MVHCFNTGRVYSCLAAYSKDWLSQPWQDAVATNRSCLFGLDHGTGLAVGARRVSGAGWPNGSPFAPVRAGGLLCAGARRKARAGHGPCHVTPGMIGPATIRRVRGAALDMRQCCYQQWPLSIDVESPAQPAIDRTDHGEEATGRLNAASFPRRPAEWRFREQPAVEVNIQRGHQGAEVSPSCAR